MWHPWKKTIAELRESLDAWKLQVKNLSSMVRDLESERDLLVELLRAVGLPKRDEPRTPAPREWIN